MSHPRRAPVLIASEQLELRFGYPLAAGGRGMGLSACGYGTGAPHPVNRDRGAACGAAPPTPPCVRVRTRRFGGLSGRMLRHGDEAGFGELLLRSARWIGSEASGATGLLQLMMAA